MHVNREKATKRLVGLYREARNSKDSASIVTAEAAMASFLDAEAALSRMVVAEAMVAEHVSSAKSIKKS